MHTWMHALLKCVSCGSSDLESGPGIRCRACGSEYPLNNNVPLMLPPASYIDVVDSISQQYLGVDKESINVAVGSALRYRVNDRVLRGEFQNIADRYIPAGVSGNSTPGNNNNSAVLICEYFNPLFRPQESSYRSFRIRNNSTFAYASSGNQPFHISYMLYNMDGSLASEGPRSRLPIPVEPGMELTVPVRIDAPHTAGEFRISVMLVQEHVKWHSEHPIFEGKIQVGTGSKFRERLLEPPHKGYFDFDEDLNQCSSFIKNVFSEIPSSTSQPLNVLELACGSDPQMIRHFQKNTRVTAVDLCYPQIQLASLKYNVSQPADCENFAFICADAFHAPFRDHQFDVVAISAALHHFVDLTQALIVMRRLLKPEGRIILLREPGKVAADDPTYIEELSNGFNEQQFELEEYEVMFERAGLKVANHQLDFECSYKASLMPVEP